MLARLICWLRRPRGEGAHCQPGGCAICNPRPRPLNDAELAAYLAGTLSPEARADVADRLARSPRTAKYVKHAAEILREMEEEDAADPSKGETP